MPRKFLPMLSMMLLAALVVGAWTQEHADPDADRRNPFPSGTLSRRQTLLKESFEQTKKDTAKLYELVSGLKVEMDNANEDVLSVSVMKKAEEIEKLAEKIKNRMKNL
jgi:hypothetical protein